VNSLRSHEGMILIDHRESPGVPDELMLAAGYPVGAGRKVFESATFTCADCERVVVMNPDRSRPRGFCRKCNHYLCDECEAIRFASGGVCRNFKQRVDEMLNQRARKGVSSEVFQSPVILIP